MSPLIQCSATALPVITARLTTTHKMPPNSGSLELVFPWKYHVFWTIQLPVITDKVTGIHEYFKVIKETSSSATAERPRELGDFKGVGHLV